MVVSMFGEWVFANARSTANVPVGLNSIFFPYVIWRKVQAFPVGVAG
jgi:hypothetical protein